MEPFLECNVSFLSSFIHPFIQQVLGCLTGTVIFAGDTPVNKTGMDCNEAHIPTQKTDYK